VGVLLNYFISPQGSHCCCLAVCFWSSLPSFWTPWPIADARPHARVRAALGIQISLACGVLMGVFYPLVAKAITGDPLAGSYSVAFFLLLGTALCALPVNYFLMRRPLTGDRP